MNKDTHTRPPRDGRERTLRACRRLALVGVAAVLAGCATFSEDGALGPVSETARERLGKDIAWARTDGERDALATRVRELLGQPLQADAAVQVALLNNRRLQAAYARLAISEAELVQASRLPNPRFSMLSASQGTASGSEVTVDQSLTFNLMALVAWPRARAVGQRRLEETQREVSLEMARLAADTRRAYFEAVAAQEQERYARQVQDAADAGAELARRMAQVGNYSKLQQAREQAFYADAVLGVAQAEREALATRERLTRLLGLDDPARMKLPAQLPALPAQVPADLMTLADFEREALARRLDVQAAQARTQALAEELGLTRTTRWINVLEFGPARVLEGSPDSGWRTGYEVSLELPLFDWGTARVARAEALYMQSVDRVAATAIQARSQLRESHGNYLNAYEVARHYRDEIVPLRKRISEENQLRYNAMLISVFELLADARVQVASVGAYIGALRDFWVAQSALEMARLGVDGLPARNTGAGE